MSRPRRTMALLTARFLDEEPLSTARRVSPGDAPALAQLMLDAYRGTIDDEGESLEAAVAEVKKTLEGGYGAMRWEASFLVPSSDVAGALDSASIVTSLGDEPLLAFAMTRPEAKRRGLAGALIRASARSLAMLGHPRVILVVTAGNVAAERLYEKLGFVEIPRP